MSIRTRLLLLVLAVWLPAAAGFALLAWYTHAEQVDATRQQVERHALAINALVEHELDARVVMARTLAATRSAREGDIARFHEEARAATQGTGNWALVTDGSWQLANTRAAYPLTNVRRARPTPLTESAPKFVFVPLAPVAQQAAITVFVPVPGVSPQRINVGVSFEPAAIQRALGHDSAPFSALTVVANDEQIIMARSRDPAKWFGTAASPGFKARVLSGGTGFAESTTLDGVRSMTYLTPPNAHGWCVVVSVPMQELDAAAQRMSAKALGASAVLLFFGLGLAMVGSRRIGNTVHTLQRAASDLGDNRVPAPLRTGVKEVDEVGRALRAAGVKASEANATLELRVQQAVEEARQAQASLLQSQRLEAIGRLTAGVAHDFNNLLQTMKTAHHMLARRVTDGPERRMLDGATRAASKAGDLVRQLMTFGRVHKLEPQVVNVADMVLKGEELTSKAVGERVRLTASLEPGLPDVYVDPVQLEMALLNLVFNARDAMPDGGNIAIRARLASTAESAHVGPGPFVRIEVADDGMGMSAETQARAFEPYFTTKPVGAGTGIGLAQVQSFARQSGGDITLASQLGQGTLVGMLLPATLAPRSSTQPAAKADDAPPRALKVLVVEDDVLVSSVTTAALEDEGFDVRVCATADDALAVLIAGEPFDVLFTDVVMPGTMNGVDLVRWAQVNRPSLPAVVTTGYAENLDAVTAAILRKPYDIDSLLSTLRSACGPGAVAADPPAAT